jgi:hypothetical protein
MDSLLGKLNLVIQKTRLLNINAEMEINLFIIPLEFAEKANGRFLPKCGIYSILGTLKSINSSLI